jgi:hypothetical protein
LSRHVLPPTVETVDDAPSPDTDHPRAACASVLVRYETRPDRRTFYPADGSTERVLGEWIAVDDEAVQSLEAWR